MKRLLTEVEKAEIIEREWAKARAKNPEIVMHVNVQDETDESGKPRVNLVIAFLKRGYNAFAQVDPAKCREVIE